MSDLPFTGERFIPGTRGEIWVEHWHRYHFASRWAVGRRVLDVACGEGYGSALLARVASQVTGVDLADEAIAHAKRAYASLENTRFARAPCTQLPIPDASIDVAVSFETLEHIEEHEAFLAELARVLTPSGLLILSCPNKLEYSDKRGYSNEFHVKELYREGLAALVRSRFPEIEWYGQRPSFFSVIAPEGGKPAAGHLVQVSESRPDEASPRLADALYFLVVASRERACLEGVAPALSVLSDRDEWVHKDYVKVMLEGRLNFDRAQALQTQVEEGERSIAGLVDEAGKLRNAIALQEAALEAQRALGEAQAAWTQAMAAEKDREIARRGGLRWWLKQPLVRLGLLK